MKKISFKVQGSTDEPYNVSINKSGNKIQCVCNCKAGVNRMHCKHWMGVFEGTKQKYIGLCLLNHTLVVHSQQDH